MLIYLCSARQEEPGPERLAEELMRAKQAVNKSLARERALQDRLNSLHSGAQPAWGQADGTNPRARHDSRQPDYVPHKPAAPSLLAPPTVLRSSGVPPAARPQTSAAPQVQRAPHVHALDASAGRDSESFGGAGGGGLGGRGRGVVAWEADDSGSSQFSRRGNGDPGRPAYDSGRPVDPARHGDDGGHWARQVPRDSLRPAGDSGRGAAGALPGARARVGPVGFGLPEAGLDAGDAPVGGRAGIPPRPPRPGNAHATGRRGDVTEQGGRAGARLGGNAAAGGSEAEADVWELAASLRILASKPARPAAASRGPVPPSEGHAPRGGGGGGGGGWDGPAKRVGGGSAQAVERHGPGSGETWTGDSFRGGAAQSVQMEAVERHGPAPVQRSPAWSAREQPAAAVRGDGSAAGSNPRVLLAGAASGGGGRGGGSSKEEQEAVLLLQRVARGRLARAWIRSLPEWRQVIRAGRAAGARRLGQGGKVQDLAGGEGDGRGRRPKEAEDDWSRRHTGLRNGETDSERGRQDGLGWTGGGDGLWPGRDDAMRPGAGDPLARAALLGGSGGDVRRSGNGGEDARTRSGPRFGGGGAGGASGAESGRMVDGGRSGEVTEAGRRGRGRRGVDEGSLEGLLQDLGL